MSERRAPIDATRIGMLGFPELPSDPELPLGIRTRSAGGVWVYGGQRAIWDMALHRRGAELHRALVVLLLLFALGLSGCQRCAALLPCARVTETTGAVERQTANGAWRALERGASLGSGEIVRTAGASFAQLALEGGGRLTLEPETVVRFLEGERTGNTAWDVKSGRILFEASQEGSEIRSSYGRILASSGARLEISGKPDSVLVLTQVGRARIESAGGTVLELQPSQSVELSASATRVDLLSEPPKGATRPQAPSAVSDIAIEAGQSLVIHDAAPPTRVRFVFGANCVEGAIELESGPAGKRSASEWTERGAAVIRVEPGSLEYKLKCRAGMGEPLVDQATGSLTIVRDDGLKRPDERPPSTAIDVTGRHYNLLYSDALPQVTFRWPDAPPAGRYALALSFLGRTRTVFSREPVYAFPAGELAEGTHQAQFSAGRIASERTVVAIRRDPSAPVLALDALPARSGAAEEAFRLTGKVRDGYQLDSNRERVEVASDGRFTLAGVWPAAGHPLVLYVRHPEREAHAYLIGKSAAPAPSP